MGALTIFKNKTKDLTAAQVEQNAVAKETAVGIGTTSELLFGSNAMQLKAAYATAYATEETKKQEKATGSANDKLKDMADRVKKVSDALTDYMVESLKNAQEALKDAQETFDDFATKVSDGLKSAFSFADAKDAGDETGLGFLQGLRDQVAGIKTYSTNVSTLLTMGLSQDALQAVLDAGGESGAAIAAELIAGGSKAILETNALVESSKTAAAIIGQQAANQWYGAGVSNAQSYLQGVEAAFAEAQKRLAKKGLKIADIKGISASFGEALSGPTVMPITPSRPEAGSGAPGTGVTVNVQGGINTSAEIGEAVVNAIRAYNRAAGPANIAVG
jgi:hypothetical protein